MGTKTLDRPDPGAQWCLPAGTAEAAEVWPPTPCFFWLVDPPLYLGIVVPNFPASAVAERHVRKINPPSHRSCIVPSHNPFLPMHDLGPVLVLPASPPLNSCPSLRSGLGTGSQRTRWKNERQFVGTVVAWQAHGSKTQAQDCKEDIRAGKKSGA